MQHMPCLLDLRAKIGHPRALFCASSVKQCWGQGGTSLEHSVAIVLVLCPSLNLQCVSIKMKLRNPGALPCVISNIQSSQVHPAWPAKAFSTTERA